MTVLMRMISVSAVAMVLLTGCSLTSTNVLLTQAVTARSVDPQGLQQVESALDQMNTVQTYDLKADIGVATGRFVRDALFYGSVELQSPVTVSMDETIGGADYVVYQSNQFAYFRNGAKWEPTTPIQDLRPWDSLRQLLATAPPKTVYQLPQQTVVSWICNVYQFTTTAAAVGPTDPQTVLPSHRIPAKALYTVWVDTTDGLVRQVQVQSTVGVPNLGTASVNATQLYFNFNQPMNLTAPSDLLSQIERP